MKTLRRPPPPHDSNNGKTRRAALVAVTGLGLLCAANVGSRLLDIPAIPPRFDAQGASLSDKGITQDLFTELGTPGHTSRIIDTRWNAFARTDVVADTETPDTYLVYTNGNVPTNMMRWDGKPQSAADITREFPLIDWVFASAPLGQNRQAETSKSAESRKQRATHGRVLSIGPGGGLDVLMALRHGAGEFEGAEINPSIVGLMRDYREFNGGIYRRPNVRVVTAEGRAYVREAAAAGKRYALIFSALTKTATAGQGMALLESYIYTQDALADYWKALDADGQAVIVTDQVPLLARLFATALAMLRERGLDEAEACRHIALVGVPDTMPGPYRYAIVLQKSPMTGRQTYAMSDAALDRSLTAILLPEGRAARDEYGPFDRVAAGAMTGEQFVAWWRDARNVFPFGLPAIDISPCPDNRPFVLDLNLSQPVIFKQLAGLTTVLALGLAVAGWRTARRDLQPATAGGTRQAANERKRRSSMAPRLKPLKHRAGRTSAAAPDAAPAASGASAASGVSAAAAVVYFALLGVGFMLVEIPLAQKLILPLGYPTLALTVILFSILLGGGAGAWFSQRHPEQRLGRRAAMCALGVALVTAAGAVFLDGARDALLSLSLPLRCAIVGALLLPLGFLLGTPFPAALRGFARRDPANVPLIWGLNGVSSVAGSLGAAMIAKAWGLNVALLVGAACYVVAALLAPLFDRADNRLRLSGDDKWQQQLVYRTFV